jgi:hypothetical protein
VLLQILSLCRMSCNIFSTENDEYFDCTDLPSWISGNEIVVELKGTVISVLLSCGICQFHFPAYSAQAQCPENITHTLMAARILYLVTETISKQDIIHIIYTHRDAVY